MKPIYEREPMATVNVVQCWGPYLLVQRFIVLIDQHALQFLLEQHAISLKYQKWLSKLVGYVFEVPYKHTLETKQFASTNFYQSTTLSCFNIIDREKVKEKVT